jgi:hypothetical protein
MGILIGFAVFITKAHSPKCLEVLHWRVPYTSKSYGIQCRKADQADAQIGD